MVGPILNDYKSGYRGDFHRKRKLRSNLWHEPQFNALVGLVCREFFTTQKRSQK